MTLLPNKRSKAASSASRRPESSRGRHTARQYSQKEITRNRIIAIIVLIAVVALLVSLVTCVAGNILGSGSSQTNAPQATASSQTTEASKTAESGAESSEAAEAEEESDQVASSDSESSQTVDLKAELSQAATPAVEAATSVALAINGVEDPWLESGRFTTGDAELDQMIKNFCDNHSSPDLSVEENAFNAYCNAAWYEYKERDNNQHPTGPTWDMEYAKQAINEGSVNCYEQAAFGEYVLKYFGYTDVYAEPCLILRQSGEYGDHGLLFVTDKDGRKCLCDPAFGANGWMLDADIYTYKLTDVGQDPSEYTIAPFEEVVPAPWI